jgi:hypothetical protein
MSTHEHPIAIQVRSAGSSSLSRAKTVVLETVPTLRETARDVLFTYAVTDSAISSLAIIAAPHLETLLRCLFHGRG